MALLPHFPGRRPASERRPSSHSLRRLLGPITLLVAAGLLACDLPTELPMWDTTWVIPAEETSVGVAELLPPGVEVSQDGAAFSVQVDPVDFSRTLGDLCAPCVPLDGLLAPKPAFQGTLHREVALPQDLISATIQGGTISVLLTNGFTFDPLRPGGATGSLNLILRNGDLSGAVVSQSLVDGAAQGFPPGATLVFSLPISGTVGSLLTIQVEVSSPAGDPTTIRTSQTLSVRGSPQGLRAAPVVARAADRSLRLDETELKVEDLDETVVDRIQRGGFLLRITNPWSIGASFTLTLSGPTMAAPVTKTLLLPAEAQSSVTLQFTQGELKSFLGKPGVVLGGTGKVAASAGNVTLTPAQALLIDAELVLVLRLGRGEG